MDSFGQRLKKLRTARTLFQEDLANKLNISKSAVGMYERNEREPSFELLEKIANFFDVSIDFLLTGTERSLSNNESNLFFFDMEGLTKKEIEDIKSHYEYVKWKSKHGGKNE